MFRKTNIFCELQKLDPFSIMKRKQVVMLVFFLFLTSYFYLFYCVLILNNIKPVEVHGFTVSHNTFTKGKHSVTSNIRNYPGRTPRQQVLNDSSNGIEKPSEKTIDKDRKKSGTSGPPTNYSEGSVYSPLKFIPRLSMKSLVVPYIDADVTKQFLALPDTNYTSNVVIVTLIRNSESSLDAYLKQLSKLSYPHHLLSMYFGECESTDGTFKKAENITKELKEKYDFDDARVIDLRLRGGLNGPQKMRHEKKYQLYRRSYLAAARNRLVQYSLQQKPFEYILSIDSDIEEFPEDLVQQMLFAKSEIVTASCLVKSHGIKYLYDCNSWRETNISLHSQASLPPDALVLECYGKSSRIFLPHLLTEGRVVKLDGVGGCALMIKADCIRSGLQFPEKLYKRHIETEGLAKMANDMGYSVVGLPFVEVYHQKWG